MFPRPSEVRAGGAGVEPCLHGEHREKGACDDNDARALSMECWCSVSRVGVPVHDEKAVCGSLPTRGDRKIFAMFSKSSFLI